jgi:hypothetical protein
MRGSAFAPLFEGVPLELRLIKAFLQQPRLPGRGCNPMLDRAFALAGCTPLTKARFD